MAKQRNSLGVVVLPSIEGQLTWEEYKKQTGIDLEDIFTVVDNEGEYSVEVKSTFSKLIVLKLVNTYKTGYYPFIAIPNKYESYTTADKTTANIKLTLLCGGDADIGFYVILNANKTIIGGAY